MADNKFTNGIAEFFGTKNQAVNALAVNNDVLNKIATKMEDPECVIEVTVSTSTKNLPIMEAIDNNLQVDLAAALIANRCRYSYVAYKNRDEVDCYMVTFYLSKNRRFKVSLTKDDETTKLINA